jgi:hypothetical protein
LRGFYRGRAVSLLGVLAAQLANGLNLQTSGPDPDPILDLFYGCGSSINWDGYCNKEVDQLIDSGRSTGWRGHVAIARLVWPEAEQGLAPAGLDTIRAKLPKKGTLPHRYRVPARPRPRERRTPGWRLTGPASSS